MQSVVHCKFEVGSYERSKLLTDADGNHISDNTNLDGVLAGLDNHVAGCFGMVDGKISQLY